MRTLSAVTGRAARVRRVPLGAGALALLALTLTCEDRTVTPVAVRDVAVTPTDTTLMVGDELELTAVVRDDAGNRLTDRAVTWSSENDQVVSVDAEGGIVALSSGEADVTAAVDGRSGTASIQVMEPEEPVASIEVDPAETQIAVGQSIQLETIAKSENGIVLEGRTATWSSSDESVAAVNGNGVVTGESAGEVTITAAIDDVEGTANVTVTEEAEPVVSVDVEPADTSIAVGETATLKAVAKSEDGAVLGGHDVSWSSDDEDVATVDAEGVVTGEGPGEATITATVEGVSGVAEVTVSTIPIDHVAIEPPEPNILVGGTVQLVATAMDEHGEPLQGREVEEWTSDDEDVASVDAQGQVTGHSEGQATISATIEDVTGTAQVTVSLVPVDSVAIEPAEPNIRVGGTVELVATALDADGEPLQGREVEEWTSGDDAVATVDAQGRVTGHSEGQATISATIEDVTGTVQVTVSLVPVDSVAIEPADTSIFVGETAQLIATAFDEDGEPLEGREVEAWSSDNEAVATVNAEGLVTGHGDGTAAITATIEGVTGTAEVTVSPVPVDGVAIEPAESSILVGETVQLEATALDADGEPLEGRDVDEWTSDDEAVAAVDNAGRVTGLLPGEATITATIEGVAGSAEVTVSLVPVESVAIEPAEASIFVGERVRLVATALDADGEPLEGREVEEWTSDDEAVATVNDAGRVRGRSPGDATITATIEGVTGTADVTVSLVPVESVAIEPAESSIFVGGTVQLEATALDADGEPLEDRDVDEWTSNNVLVATVNNAGRVTGLLPGEATITATIEGVAGTAEVTVELVPVEDVTIDPAETSIFVDETVQLVATALDANGEPLDGRDVDLWASDNAAAAAVDAQGLVTGRSAGDATITATIEDVLGTAEVTVSLAPVEAVAIEPAESSLLVGGTVQLEATALNPDGEPLEDRDVDEWTSNNALVATVNNAGRVTGLLPGEATISATIEGVIGTANVTVNLLPPGGVDVEPADASDDVTVTDGGESVEIEAGETRITRG